MPENVLFVDDEENVLNALERIFYGQDIRIFRAGNAEEALRLIESEKIAVLVSDNRMPGMTGLELLSRVKDISPDTMRVLMTAYADLATAVEAINKGEVFRFVIKPWDNTLFEELVHEGIERYRTINALRGSDEAKMLSLAQTIELKDPYTRGHCDRVARYALIIAEVLELPEPSKKEIRHGSWLHDCGKIGVPERILNLNGPLDEEGILIMRKHPLWGAEVARQAQLSPVIVNVILCHHERYDGRGYPAGLREKQIPLEARIIAIADVFDAMTTDRPYKKGCSTSEAAREMLTLKGTSFDPQLADIFLEHLPVVPNSGTVTKHCRIPMGKAGSSSR